MNEKSALLANLLIRNFNEAIVERQVREPLYESLGARFESTDAETTGGTDEFPYTHAH